MDDDEWLAERFQAERTHLRAVAYRMLGSISEADDAVQQTWLRLSRADSESIENLGGWLTTVVARVCLNMLRSRTSRREEPLEVHVPDPLVSGVAAIDPEQETLLADSVGLALLVVLDTLAPGRAAGLRAPRHVRRALRRHRRDGRPHPGRRPPAGQPGPAPGAARRGRARRRPRPPARGGRRLLRRRPPWRLRRPRRRPRPRRRAALRRRRPPRGDGADPGSRRRGRPGAHVLPPLGRSSGRPWSTGRRGSSSRRAGRPTSVMGFTVRDGRIVEIDAISDPARLRRLEVGVPPA